MLKPLVFVSIFCRDQFARPKDIAKKRVPAKLKPIVVFGHMTSASHQSRSNEVKDVFMPITFCTKEMEPSVKVFFLIATI